MTTVGDRIRAAREAKHLPRTALAALVGVSTTTVKRWETGWRFPDVLELHAIAKATQADAVELLGTREQIEPQLARRAAAILERRAS